MNFESDIIRKVTFNSVEYFKLLAILKNVVGQRSSKDDIEFANEMLDILDLP